MSQPDPAAGPPETLDAILEEARGHIDRLSPREARAAQHEGALLVDIRPEEQRRENGLIEGAIVIDRNVLEWRLAPSSRWRIAEVSDPGRQVVLVCNQGFQSSLAAYTLRRLGVARVADLIGGFEAWRSAELPITGWSGAAGDGSSGRAQS